MGVCASQKQGLAAVTAVLDEMATSRWGCWSTYTGAKSGAYMHPGGRRRGDMHENTNARRGRNNRVHDDRRECGKVVSPFVNSVVLGSDIVL